MWISTERSDRRHSPLRQQGSAASERTIGNRAAARIFVLPHGYQISVNSQRSLADAAGYERTRCACLGIQ
jgi:hypothetical protein